MNKKERLLEFNRSNILPIAKELFLEKGITQTTMDEIAKKADYSKSTVYVYFKSKDEIFDCIVLEYFILLKNSIEEALSNAENFPDGFFAICNSVAKLYSMCPMFLDSILGKIKIAADEPDSTLLQIYLVGEQIDGILENYISKKLGIPIDTFMQSGFNILLRTVLPEDDTL